MKILAFDTSSDVLSVAIFDGERILAFSDSEVLTRQSEALVPALQKAMKSAKCPPRSIGCIAVGIGPGSFTGLRIGVTTAKVLSYALKAKLIGISSLEAMARSVGTDGTFAVMADAKRSRVYGAVYKRFKGRWQVLQKPKLFLREDFLDKTRGSVSVVENVCPSALEIGRAALERMRRKCFDDPLELEPLYLLPKDCNVTKKSSTSS